MNPHLAALVRRRARFCCEYCRLPQKFSILPFEIDHIIALKHGGPSTENNLAFACFYCNSSKGPNLAGIDPISRLIVPLFHPRRQRWSRHFRWDGGRLVGRTRNGRATIAVLDVNEPVLIALRETLMADALFPLDE